ncbi:hypothetical protein MMC12_004101 [Toensbergia leucococca]|nr:hypothetical protein [Toensbergia leucococca]
MNPKQPTIASTDNSATLRPRTRRLVSIDGGSALINSSSSASTDPRREPTVSSSFSSRAHSPIPSKHPSRSASSNRKPRRSLSSDRPSASEPAPAKLTSGLWETSWSSLQGIASNLLSGDPIPESRGVSRTSRRNRPVEVKHTRNTSAPPAQWGPLGGTTKQAGSSLIEYRKAQLQAMKRETLLSAGFHTHTDASGQFKRRNSDDRGSASAPPSDLEDRDALVYLHRVRASDTLAGVLIKYCCQPAAFRKANRLWPNDSIQVRKTVILPIDACGVKGRKVPEPTISIDLLGEECIDDTMETPTNAQHAWGNLSDSLEAKETPLSSIPTSPSISVSNFDESPWKHESWIILDGHPDAVEIVRLPCNTLGFFPPTRRKSLSYSDLDTPPASLDLPRSTNQDTSPRRVKSRSSSGSFFARQMQGPGGVGTLGKEVHSPGPAQDRLNKLFAAHLPNVAPRASLESSTSTSSTGIENMGGAIEGWVRKFATRAAATLQSNDSRDRSGIGDLIELSDAFELGGDQRNDEEGSSRAQTGTESSGIRQQGSGKERVSRKRELTRDSARKKGD